MSGIISVATGGTESDMASGPAAGTVAAKGIPADVAVGLSVRYDAVICGKTKRGVPSGTSPTK